MTASYPGSVRAFTPKVNVIDIVEAADPNSLQEEVVAIESTLGVSPAVSTTATTSGWSNVSNDYGTLTARLANIEKGIVSDTHSQYVNKSGGSTITTSAGTIGVVVKGAAAQTANLQEWQNSSGTVVASISAAGVLTTSSGVIDVITPALLLGGM